MCGNEQGSEETVDTVVHCQICSEPSSIGKYSKGNNKTWLPIRYCHNCGLLKSDGTKANKVSEAIIGQETFTDLPHGYTPKTQSS